MTVRTDNLFIAHYQGSLLEEFHYYPFGMCFDVSKSPTLGKSAAVKYNSQLHEHDEFEDANVYGLEDYNFAFRNYDAQIGRWLQPDPLMQHPSPYLAMSNNPVSFTDPLGLWDFDGLDNGDDKPKPPAKNAKNKNVKNGSKTDAKKNLFGFDSGHIFLNDFELPDNSSGTEVLNVHGKKRSVGSAYGEKAGRYISSTKNWAKGLKAGKGEGLKQENVDFGGAVAGGVTIVFGTASHYSGFVKAAGKVGVVGNVVTGLTYGHAIITRQAKPSHHLDAAITGTFIIGGLVSLVVPPISPYVIGFGFGYGGTRLVGGEAFDNWFNSQFNTKPTLIPYIVKP